VASVSLNSHFACVPVIINIWCLTDPQDK